MKKELIYTQFTRGEISKGTLYEEELKALYVAFKNQLQGGGCRACRRNAVIKNFRHQVEKVLAKYNKD